MKISRKSRNLKTLEEFGAALKIPISTLSGWIRHDLWKWKKRSPWPRAIVPEVLRWGADNLERGRPSREKSDPDGADTIADLREEKLKQEARKLRAQADQAETASAKDRGELHDADACEEERIRAAAMMRNAFQNVAPQTVSAALSAGMPHEAAPAFQKHVAELVNACLRYLAASPDARSEDSD